MVGVDIYRPAAIKQLQVVGEQVGVPVFERGTQTPAKTVVEAYEYAKRENHDVVLVDTAGRLHIDENLMEELKDIEKAVSVSEVLLVLDAMTGQDAVNVAKTFDESLSITGVVLTKLDGDARGGAALSIGSVVDKPIKFITTGEKLDKIESFKPDRLAGRILGMGDVLSLIEKAEAVYDQKKAEELEQKMRDMSFTFDDFLEQMAALKKMGPIKDIMGMIPGMNSKALGNIEVDEKQMARIEAIIRSMTPMERAKPDIIDASRKERIANGSGTSPVEVQKLLKQFKDTKKMMKKFGNMTKKKKPGKMGFPFFK